MSYDRNEISGRVQYNNDGSLYIMFGSAFFKLHNNKTIEVDSEEFEIKDISDLKKAIDNRLELILSLIEKARKESVSIIGYYSNTIEGK
jgi:hypothetical protein